ncbi:MAG TPA: polyphosphate kinase 2 family protein [Planctomycetaceae bacterium]|nr:polyphosphate kinase 2 family protein [Planctomycetaceae bacterium]
MSSTKPLPGEKAIRKRIELCRVRPGQKVRLAEYNTEWGGADLKKGCTNKQLESLLNQDVSRLAKAQDLLAAFSSWALLVILQAMDAAGKDSTIKHVMSGVNPQGCQVYAFKPPSEEELKHTFLWRCMKALPERGRIGIFNRSHYEDVLVVKVHPELLASQHLPAGKPNKEFWEARYDDINQFERHLERNGTRVVKFFLHVSKNVQRKRFLKRLSDPKKAWKFAPGDLHERACWDEYIDAYEKCLTRTSTEWAPWHIIPADHKRVTRALVAEITAREIHKLDLHYPKVDAKLRTEFKAARQRLQCEKR